jgi:signal transduction histidine kinase
MPSRHRPQFALFLQAGLIVVPIAILSGVALHFLREDQAAMEQDARDRSSELAPEAARQIGQFAAARLRENPGRLIQGEIADGKPRAVPDYSDLPIPSDWPARLPPAQAQLWKIAQGATFRKPNRETARRALEALRGAASPPARANSELGLLQIAAERGVTPTLIRQAIDLAKRFPDDVTESGTPVAALALLLAMRRPGDPLPDALFEAVASNVGEHPSFLVPELIRTVAQAFATSQPVNKMENLKRLWNGQENARAKTRELMANLAGRLTGARGPVAVRISPYLAFCNPTPHGWRVTAALTETVDAAIQAWRPRLPDYLGASVEIAGERRRIGDSLRRSPGTALASAPGSLDIQGPQSFTLILDLYRPEALSAPYQRRLRLTQWLILSSAATALIGLVTLFTGYRRQARLSAMQSNFVSSVSHELRAPIAAVRLMAESLESGRVTSAGQQTGYYRLIVRECRRLSTLLENVLDSSRIDQDRKQYRFEPVDAAALLRHTVGLMEPNAAERQVHLALTEPPPAFETLQPCWDGEAIEQSLVNLLDNAIKHSPGGAEVRVEIEAAPEAVRLWVADHGPGIPPAEQQRIFERFYRRGSELRRETAGIGIGLSIVKHVVEAHGGRVLLESTVGQGSRFGLELPVRSNNGNGRAHSDR